jgi:peptidylprolyl isomerase
MDGKVYFAEIDCSNVAFAFRLHERIILSLKREEIMGQAKHGDTVKVHYRGKLHDGSVFDATFDREPLQFTIGGGQIIPGLEEAVVGMNPGDSKTTELPVEKGFGPHRDDLVVVVAKSKLADLDLEAQVGVLISIPQSD